MIDLLTPWCVDLRREGLSFVQYEFSGKSRYELCGFVGKMLVYVDLCFDSKRDSVSKLKCERCLFRKNSRRKIEVR